jgi:hypothetical protein
MPYATRRIARGLVKRIARSSPFPACFLTQQSEAGSPRPRQLSERRRNKLTPAVQRIDETSHRLGRFGRPDRFVIVMLALGFEQLGDVLAVRIMRFQHFDALDRVATTQRQKRIAYPIAPGLEAAERPPAFEVLRVLPAAAPDRQAGGQQLKPVVLDFFKEARTKRAALGIFAAGIEFAAYSIRAQNGPVHIVQELYAGVAWTRSAASRYSSSCRS